MPLGRRGCVARRAIVRSPAVFFRLDDTALAVIVLAIILAAIVFSDCVVHAQDRPAIARATPTRDQRALALAVARTAANESGFSSPNDVALIYETTRQHGTTDRARLAWLRRHSPCTNGGDCNHDGTVDERDTVHADTRRQNARWSRHLTDGDERPRGYPPRMAWRPNAWRAVREFALRLVVADRPTHVCGGVRVVTWGSHADFASGRFAAHVEAHDCGAANLGGTWRARSRTMTSRSHSPPSAPGSVVAANVARGLARARKSR